MPAPAHSLTVVSGNATFLSWIARLVHQHRERLAGYARRQGLEAEDALDAVQDAFLSFLRLPEAHTLVDAPEDSVRLLTVLVKNQVRNRRRGRARRLRLLTQAADAGVLEPAAAPDSAALLAEAETLAQVRRCVRQLPRLQAAVVRLSLLDALGDTPASPADPESAARTTDAPQPRPAAAAGMARALGITPNHAAVLLHRARRHLRTCVDHPVHG